MILSILYNIKMKIYRFQTAKIIPNAKKYDFQMLGRPVLEAVVSKSISSVQTTISNSIIIMLPRRLN